MQGQQQDTSVNGIPLDPNAKYGGVLQSAFTQEGPTFSTWEEAAGNSFTTVHPVSNMLLQRQTWGTEQDYTNGAVWNLKPDLAKEWEQSQDGLTWTFTFFDGVNWSDGTPFTCADAKWSFDTVRTGDGLNRSPRAIHLAAIDSIACVNDLTMVITLKRPKSGLLDALNVPYNVIRPKHIYENNTEALRTTPPEVGTGPFRVANWLPGESLTLERRDDYWNQPFPYLDGIEYRLLNQQAQVAGLRAGRLDTVGGNSNWSGSRAEQLLRECDLCQAWPRAAHPGFLYSLVPNSNRAPWNTPEIRQVLALAVDKTKVRNIGYEGWGELGTGGIYLPGSFWAMPYERVKQIPGYDFEQQEQNKERARQLLAQAGYQPGELTLSIPFWNQYDPYAITVAEDLNAVGIVATNQSLEIARAYDIYSTGEFDVAGHAGYIGGFDPDFVLYEWFYTGSDRNYGRYSNPEFDRLVDLQSVTLDPEERRRLAWDAAEIALRDYVRIIPGMQMLQPIFAKRVQNFMPGPPSQASYGNWNRFEHVWLAE
jgi:peptide/nickel transport system substrate-binding protein